MKLFNRIVRVPLTIALLAVLQSGTAVAYPLSTDDAFCARVQQFIAGTDMQADNVLYEPDSYWGTFKKSKPLAQPLTTHQFVGYQLPDGARADYPVTVACKMKTAERIRTANAISGDVTVADEDQACQQWLGLMLDDVYRALQAQGEEDLLAKDHIALAEENNVYIGPLWLRPEVYQVAYREGGQVKLRSKALHVEYRRFMPVPDSFMGTHYCTMIAPEYLARLVQGEVEAPPLQE